MLWWSADAATSDCRSAIAFADRGARRRALRRQRAAVELVNGAQLPFDEPGADAAAQARSWQRGACRASTDPAIVGTAEHVVVVIGTPVDEHLNPDPTRVPSAIEVCSAHLRDGQLLVLRSTVYPGVTALVEQTDRPTSALDIDVAFCPERIAEGKAMTELFELPQIVVRPHRARPASGPAKLFGDCSPTIVRARRRRKPSWPSCSRTPGATSSSPPPTSSS